MSLQIWLPLNGNLDNQGLSNVTINNHGATVDNNGKIGKCYSFNVRSNYITIPSFSIPENFSICIWGKWNSLNNWSRLLDFGSLANGKGYGFLIANNSTTSDMMFDYECGSGSVDVKIGTIVIDTWYHIAVTFQGTNIKIYLNGNLVKTVTSASPVGGHTLNYNYLGKSNWSADALLNGSINDFCIYDHCLSAKEVKEISKGLVCHYPLKSQYETGQVNKYSGDTAEGKIGLGSVMTVTKLSDERGYNYKVSYTGTGSSYWIMIYAPRFSFTPGKKYYYSCKIRCRKNLSFGIRAARTFNDWTTSAVGLIADGEWHEYVVSQVINETFTRDGSTITCDPGLEIVSGDLSSSGHAYSADFDIKDIQVIESDCYVPFIDNDMVSNVVSDCSGYGNDGTTNGTIVWSDDSARYSGSYNFNGTGYVKNTSFNYNAIEMTISFWLKMPQTVTNQHFLFGTFDSFTGNGIGYWRDVGCNYYNVILRSSAESSYVSLATSGLTANTWNYIAIVYTGTECILYVNGVENKRVTYGKNGTIANPVCYLGNSLFNNTPSSETDESSMSDFRIYATALSEEDIKSIYNVSASIDKTGILSCYEFSEKEE